MNYLRTIKLKRIELKFTGMIKRELETLPPKIEPDNIRNLIEHIAEFSVRCHKLYGEYVTETLKQHKCPPACSPECSNCCHHYPMSVEPFEIIQLYNYLRTKENFMEMLEACWLRSSVFSDIYEEIRDEDAALHKYFDRSLPCPFMKNKACSIYKIRPMSCRMYFSITPQKFCTPKYLKSTKNKNFIIYLPDQIEALLDDLSQKYTSLNLSEAFYKGIIDMNMYEEAFQNSNTNSAARK